ncbi:MAG TPA: hypothetical protein PLS38_00805, partial [Solirubrobacterales bacterium]|nr:hypothetical protein [Solirubrobacterales bacterium]
RRGGRHPRGPDARQRCPGGDEPPNREANAPGTPVPAAEPLPVPVDTPETERIETLERQIAGLNGELAELRGLVDELRRELGV